MAPFTPVSWWGNIDDKFPPNIYLPWIWRGGWYGGYGGIEIFVFMLKKYTANLSLSISWEHIENQFNSCAKDGSPSIVQGYRYFKH